LNGFTRWWRREFGRRREPELSVHELLGYATTEQEIRDAVLDYNADAVRGGFKRGAYGQMAPLLNADDVVKERRDRRQGNA
jgi:hypothetical protein